MFNTKYEIPDNNRPMLEESTKRIGQIMEGNEGKIKHKYFFAFFTALVHEKNTWIATNILSNYMDTQDPTVNRHPG